MFRRIVLTGAALAFAALLFAAPRSADAASRTANLAVSANVLGSCRILAAQSLGFGDYDPSVASALDVNGTITINCTNGTGYTIVLDNGLNGDATTRRMTGGASGSTDTLQYQLYTDAGRTLIWNATNTVTGTAGTAGTGLQVYTIPLYGRIPAGQTVSTGTYGDTVVMTVSF